MIATVTAVTATHPAAPKTNRPPRRQPSRTRTPRRYPLDLTDEEIDLLTDALATYTLATYTLCVDGPYALSPPSVRNTGREIFRYRAVPPRHRGRYAERDAGFLPNPPTSLT